MTHRARQIQADEGIYRPPLSNLSPTDASNSQQEDSNHPHHQSHFSSEHEQQPARGRARAGTLPSSWADLGGPSGPDGNGEDSIGGVQLGLGAVGAGTNNSRGNGGRSSLAPGSERDRSGTVGSKELGVSFSSRASQGAIHSSGSQLFGSKSSYGPRPTSASEMSHQFESPPTMNNIATPGPGTHGGANRFGSERVSPTPSHSAPSPEPGNRLRSGSLTLPSIGPSIWRESGSERPNSSQQGGLEPSSWSSSNQDPNERSSTSPNTNATTLSQLQNRLRASTMAGGPRPGGENDGESANDYAGAGQLSSGGNLQGRLRSSTYATKTVGFGSPTTHGSAASSAYENDDYHHHDMASRSRSNSQSQSNNVSGAQSPSGNNPGGSSAASLASAALQNRLGALSLEEQQQQQNQPSHQSMRPRATTVGAFDNNNNYNQHPHSRKQVYDLGVATEEEEYEQGHLGSGYGSSNNATTRGGQGLGSGFSYSSRPSSFALSSLSEREPSNFGKSHNSMSGFPTSSSSSGLVGAIPEYDIFTAYALEHGLDPAAFAKAAEAAGLANVLTSPSVTGHTGSVGLSSPAKLQGRLRAGTVATLGGPGAGNRMRQELELMRVSASNTASNINSSLRSTGGVSKESDHAFDLAKGAGLGAPYGSAARPSSNNDALHDLSHMNDSHLAGPPSTPGGSSSINNTGIHTPGGTISLQGSSNGQTPNRSLWIGNLDATTTGQELMQVFAPYGAIESLRLLPEKVGAFTGDEIELGKWHTLNHLTNSFPFHLPLFFPFPGMWIRELCGDCRCYSCQR